MDLTVVLIWLLAAALVIAGVVGAVVPILPGLPLVFGGLLLAAWSDDFERVGSITLTLLGLLLVLGIAADFVAASLGAKRYGASPRAAWGALVGSLVGIFFGLPGLLLGPLMGAVVGELSARSTVQKSAKVGAGTLIGLLLGAAAKIALSLAMIGVFLFAWFV